MTFENRERRREPRFQLEEPAQITVLTPSRPLLHGAILDVSRQGLQLRVEQALPLSVPLQIRAGDFLLLGEAVFCAAHEGQFRAGVQIEQRIGPLALLADWHRPFFGETEEARGREILAVLRQEPIFGYRPPGAGPEITLTAYRELLS